MKSIYKVELSKEAENFLLRLGKRYQAKFVYYIRCVEEGVIKDTYFKKLKGYQLWEFKYVPYRLLSFMARDDSEITVIYITHGFVKKSNSTPKKEIDKALSVRNLMLQ